MTGIKAKPQQIIACTKLFDETLTLVKIHNCWACLYDIIDQVHIYSPLHHGLCIPP